jgi:2-phosphosulfolactate phosphatase
MGIVVVIDVLRATSAMVVAFEKGVEGIIPVATVEEARKYIDKPGYIAAAERNGEVVQGFSVGNSPLAFAEMDLKGKTVVMTTTNGTRAIEAAKDAKQLIIGSFLNMTALTDYLAEQNENVLLLCSGWREKINLEDTSFAGAVVDRLLNTGRFGAEEDSSIAAQYLFKAAQDNFRGILKAAPHRRRLEKLDLYDDAKFCLTPDQYTMIPVLENGVLRAMKRSVKESS